MTDATRTPGAPAVELPMLGRLGVSAAALAAANAGLLVVYFLYDATLFQLVLVYWCECLWIGVFSGVKLLVASLFGLPYESRWVESSRGGAVIMSIIVIGFTGSAFFSLLGLLLMMILAANEWLPLGVPDDRAINHVGLVFGVSLLFLAGHGMSLVINFLLLGEFRRARVAALVALPFKRCLALLAAILFAVAVVATVPGFATTTGFAAALIVAKLVLDLRLHAAERRSFAASDA